MAASDRRRGPRSPTSGRSSTGSSPGSRRPFAAASGRRSSRPWPRPGRGGAAALVELIHSELEWRLKAGEPARVEEYLVAFPELNRDRRGARRPARDRVDRPPTGRADARRRGVSAAGSRASTPTCSTRWPTARPASRMTLPLSPGRRGRRRRARGPPAARGSAGSNSASWSAAARSAGSTGRGTRS